MPEAGAGFLGGLEYVLEEGPRNDWFGDGSVLLLAWISGLSAIAFFARAFLAKAPIVDLRALADRNFALGSLFSFVLGIGLYGLTYLYSLYLAEIRGYDARMIGETVFVSGLAMFIAAPVTGRLITRVDPRLILAAGFISFAIGSWWMTYLTADWDFWELVVAADLPRRRPDDGNDPHQQRGARHAAAGASEECLGPV